MNIFISGWAVAPNWNYSKNLKCEVIDSTKIVAEYKTIENIVQNFDKIFPNNIETLNAWSMGAIIVLGVLPKIRAKKIKLFSPTLKFVENESIWEELKKLRQNISEDKNIALKLFFRKCGIPKELTDTSYYAAEELLIGLDFLEKTEICEIVKPNNYEISVICGENDKIISQKSSFEVAEKLGVKPVVIPNGSHFFDFSISK
jgi:hypothetical protein